MKTLQQEMAESRAFSAKYSYLFEKKLEYLGNIFEAVSLSHRRIWLQDVNDLDHQVVLTEEDYNHLVLTGEIHEADL